MTQALKFMTTEEMKLAYERSTSLKEASELLGMAEYKIRELRAHLGWRRPHRHKRKPQRTPQRSIYDSVTTSWSGEITHED